MSTLEERLSILQSRHQSSARQAEPTPEGGAGVEDDRDAQEVDLEENYTAELNLKDMDMAQRRKYLALKAKRARLEKEWKAHMAKEGE